MFRINRRTDYAVRVCLALAKHPSGSRLSTHTIQNEMLVPPAFLQRIIADLAKAGLIATFPGPNGGIELAYPAAEISLRQIWEAIEGPLCISECVHGEHECPLGSRCPVRLHWSGLQQLILNELASTTLDLLASEAAEIASCHPSSSNLDPGLVHSSHST